MSSQRVMADVGHVVIYICAAVSTKSSADETGRQHGDAPQQQPTLMQRLVRTALTMLDSGQLQHCKSALQLLASAERAITAHSPEMLGWFSSEIWTTCRCV